MRTALPNKTVKAWLERATPEQKKLLAERSRTSVQHLQHIASGRRAMSAELAQRIATASERFDDAKLHLAQQSLCRACQHCPLLIDPLQR